MNKLTVGLESQVFEWSPGFSSSWSSLDFHAHIGLQLMNSVTGKVT